MRARPEPIIGIDSATRQSRVGTKSHIHLGPRPVEILLVNGRSVRRYLMYYDMAYAVRLGNEGRMIELGFINPIVSTLVEGVDDVDEVRVVGKNKSRND